MTLHSLLESKKFDKFFEQLNNNPDIDINGDLTCKNPLIFACKNRFSEAASQLLEKGANPNVQTYDGYTPLMLACENYDFYVVKKLLEKGADPNLKNNNGETALICACKYGELHIVKALLDHGADLNAQEDQTGNTPLLIACDFRLTHSREHFYTDIAFLLLDKGADPTIQNKDGNNALMVSCYHKRKLTVAKMLEKDINLDAQDKDGNTALMISCYYSFEGATLLLEKGASTLLINNNNETAIHIAAKNKFLKSINLFSYSIQHFVY